jgi:hypothetical protein
MPEPTQPVSQKTPRNFAAMLASFTRSGKQGTDGWDVSAPARDVATIRYEQALRKYRRMHTPEYATERLPEDSAASALLAPPSNPATAEEKSRKTASITLRLTAAEHAQLQQRAAAAQLTVSTYLRSCIFEAESLRTQVKDCSGADAGCSTTPKPRS